jgi:hypothetical protein
LENSDVNEWDNYRDVSNDIGSNSDLSDNITGSYGGVVGAHILGIGGFVHESIDSKGYENTTYHLRLGPGMFLTGGTEGAISVHTEKSDINWAIGFGGDWSMYGDSGGGQVLVNKDSVTGSISHKGSAVGISWGIDFVYTLKSDKPIIEIP